MQEANLGMMGGAMSSGDHATGDHNRQLKAEIATHPLYEQLLSAHVSCLRVATPIDQLPLIDAQLSQSHHLLRSYISQQTHSLSPHDRQELDNFLAQYLIVLCTFKEQLQQHVRVHAVEAVMACRDIENTLQALTGVNLGEGSGATMSDDEDELQMDFSLDQSSAEGHDMMGFGLPTESERSLMERVRQELKIELKQGFKSRIEDVREEILRKRRAGKLPGDTTSVLKNWWQQHAKWPYPTVGLMNTHDEVTRQFFKHSSVRVLLCPRSGGKGHSWVKTQEAGTIYTHHQKTVIVDADAGQNKRKIVAFIGGLDLCVGRYDTPTHSIFRTLQTTHKDDFHNPNFEGPVTGCPREPWHDLHSKVDGPAAYDILTNFEERWLRALKMTTTLQKMKTSHDDSLLRIERIRDIVGIDEVACKDEGNPENWHVQVFRSIDSNSVKGFPKEPKDAIKRNLVCGKNVMIDMSIHSAYVEAIRAAQKFIYIENQYFLGSSYNWDSFKDLGANNLIPMEIALKIAEKIKRNERFSVYIVIPMWPEGVPSSTATQRILFWQFKTMQMMYETIYKALEEAGLENKYEPQDYLNFFCLGNRELPDNENITNSVNPTGQNTPQVLTQKNRRFMIYVHSKGMIVDDEYVLMGSANINQRSMEGTRDTEIAMGAYQPNHTWANKHSKPHGQVHGYRMSLWSEHIGGVEECFEQPESLECVRRIRSLSEYNWRQYVADEVTEMKSHLLKYPLEVDSKGKVKPLFGCETFPDVGGNIKGTFTVLKENLTI